MKAVIFQQYGPPEVLKIAERDVPVPQPHEILIKNYAAAVNSADWRLRKAVPAAVRLAFGLFKPKKEKQVLGGVYAGVIERTGPGVTAFRAGDRVFGMTGMAMGAYAEYVCVREDGAISRIPDGVLFNDAAAVPFGGMTALHFLRKASVRTGQTVLIYGASGSVGTAAIQLARHFGAKVTAVCSSKNGPLVKSLGADVHIDYRTEDFTSRGELYDVVFETVNKLSFAKSIQCLKPGGHLILAAAGISEALMGIWTNLRGRKKVIFGLAPEQQEQIRYLRDLLASGIFKPVIDRVYPLEDIAEAHCYVEAGHKRGNVVIEINKP